MCQVAKEKRSPQMQMKIDFTKCKNFEAKKNINSLMQNLKDKETELNQLKKTMTSQDFKCLKIWRKRIYLNK